MSIKKIKIINNHPKYQKGQIYDLEEKIAISLLTNGKAIRIHRQTSNIMYEKTEKNLKEKSPNKTSKKPKKYYQ
jgi:hypothetical protein